MNEFADAERLLDEGKGEEAMPILRRLAEQGRVTAMSSIGHTYLHGIGGIEKNHDLAFSWFTRAAENGCPQAMYHLGLCNANGFGTPKNGEQALKWYTKSAERGDEDAEYRVGDCYENGIGCAANREEAIVWYRRAADHGQSQAAERLSALEVDE